MSSILSVVIVTLKSEESLEQCIQSIIAQGYPFLEIIIVNNGKAENLVDLKAKYPAIIILQNERNCFYASAQNQGIKASIGEFVLCLNDDVFLGGNFIIKALEGFNIDDRIGAVSGKVLSLFDKKVIDSTGLFLGRSRKPIDRGYRCVDRGQFDQEGYIFGVPGAVGVYRKAMLEDIAINGEYFDSSYNIFYEDLDLCWRAQIKRWKIYYKPQAIAYHCRGKTVQNTKSKGKLFMRYAFSNLSMDLQLMLLRNRYSTIIKNDLPAKFLVNILFVLAYDIRLWFYILFFRPVLMAKFLKDLSWIKTSIEKRKITNAAKVL